MCADDTLEAVAARLDGDIVVAGPDEDHESAADETRATDQPRVVGIGDEERLREAVRDVGVVVVAMDDSLSATDSLVRTVGDTEGFVVAVFSGYEDGAPKEFLLETLDEAVDVTLLACRQMPGVGSQPAPRSTGGARSAVAIGGALDFARMIREPGRINIDLADARTVLTDGAPAVLGRGAASLATEGSKRAVRRAFEEIPSRIGASRGSAALVSVTGGPEMSIGDATAAARAVRDEVGSMDDLIWGVATDDALVNQVTVDIVVDGVTYRPPLSAGDPCRRCGAALVVYTLGEQQTLACEECGFAELSVSLGG